MTHERLEYQRRWRNKRKVKLKPVASKKGEVWRNVIGYEKYYMISNLGRVKRLESLIPNKRWGSMVVQEKLLSFGKTKGYMYCRLSKLGVGKSYLVHRLVAIHFIPNPENKPEVNHLKGKNDNRVKSIEWSTKKENMKHSISNGLHKSGEKHPKSVLKKEQVLCILNSKMSERKLSVLYGVSRSAINCIKSGRSWNKEYNAYKQLVNE